MCKFYHTPDFVSLLKPHTGQISRWSVQSRSFLSKLLQGQCFLMMCKRTQTRTVAGTLIWKIMSENVKFLIIIILLPLFRPSETSDRTVQCVERSKQHFSFKTAPRSVFPDDVKAYTHAQLK